MERNAFLEVLRFHPLVPVIKLDNSDDARVIGKGLMDGGLPVAEVTFRSSFAAEGIRVLRREFPDMLVGAGTVLTTVQADQALDAGAQFIVSPGFNPPVVDHVLSRGELMVPGVTTPSEIEWAMAKGLELLKFFPAEASGGVAFLKAVAAVYPQVRFMPTGGITSANMNDYLALSHIIACGGSWMVKKVDSRWIAEETRKALNIIRGSRDI